MVRFVRDSIKLKLLPVCLAFIVAGCASRVPSTIYDLVVTPEPGIAGSNSTSQVLLPLPRSVRALNTDNIAVVSSGNEISYFTGVKWSDDLPILVQAKLVEVFEHSGSGIAVGVPGDRILADYRVVTEVRSFHFDVIGGRRAVVAIVAKIVDESSGKLLDSRLFQSQIPVPSRDTRVVVSALNDAANEVLTEIAVWALQRVD